MRSEGELMTPKGWFKWGHELLGVQRNCDNLWLIGYSSGTMVWVPPPGGSIHALKELQQARQKIQKSLHIFVCPCFLFTEWRRPLYCWDDMIFQFKAGSWSFWPAEMHETLFVALLFPYLSRDTWELKGSGLMVGLEKKCFSLFKSDERSGCNLLS